MIAIIYMGVYIWYQGRLTCSIRPVNPVKQPFSSIEQTVDVSTSPLPVQSMQSIILRWPWLVVYI